jgi:hypothetical protein
LASIFLSYAHEDKARAERLARALEAEGWSVFWDRTIPSGRTWRDYIGNALHEANCIVVAWSRASIASDWVHEEADEGRDRKILVPVLLDNVKPPLGFRSIQAEALINWDGSPAAGEFRKLVGDIEHFLGSPSKQPSESTPKAAMPEPEHQASTDPQPSEMEPKTEEPRVVQSKRQEHSHRTHPAESGVNTPSSGLPKIAVLGLAGLLLIGGLAVLLNVDEQPPAPEKTDFLSANPQFFSDKSSSTSNERQAPSEVEFYLKEAQAKLEKGHLQRLFGEGGAIHYFKLALDKDPENPTAVLGLTNAIDDALSAIAQTNSEKGSREALEQFIAVIQEACEKPPRALFSKCASANQIISNVLNTMHQGSMNAIRNIRG